MEQLQSHYMRKDFLYMRKCANIQPYMRRPLVMYVWFCNCSILNILILYINENLIFFFISVAHLLSLKNSVFWRRRFGNHHYVAAPFDVKGKIDGKRSCDLASWSWSFTKWRIDYFNLFANYFLEFYTSLLILWIAGTAAK